MRKEGRKRSGGQGRLWNRRMTIVTTVHACSPDNPGIAISQRYELLPDSLIQTTNVIPKLNLFSTRALDGESVISFAHRHSCVLSHLYRNTSPGAAPCHQMMESEGMSALKHAAC